MDLSIASSHDNKRTPSAREAVLPIWIPVAGRESAEEDGCLHAVDGTVGETSALPLQETGNRGQSYTRLAGMMQQSQCRPHCNLMVRLQWSGDQAAMESILFYLSTPWYQMDLFDLHQLFCWNKSCSSPSHPELPPASLIAALFCPWSSPSPTYWHGRQTNKQGSFGTYWCLPDYQMFPLMPGLQSCCHPCGMQNMMTDVMWDLCP